MKVYPQTPESDHQWMSSTRSKGGANLTNFTDDPERIGRNGNRRKNRNMADAGNEDPQHQQPEEHEDNKAGDNNTAAPTEMYLPDLDNTPLSQALKKGLDWGVEDEVMVECPKLKQYFGVDTLLVQRTSGWVHLHTKDEDETFPINCSRTKFPIPLLKKALEGAGQQRATPKDLPGEDWPHKIKTILHRSELDSRLDAYAALVGRYARNSVSLEHVHMVSRGSTDGYYRVAKYEIRGRKISNRMDEILAILMQDNAYREQAKIRTYPTPTTNPVNQLITSPTKADKSGSCTKGSRQHHGNSLPIRARTTVGWNQHRDHTHSPVCPTHSPLGQHSNHGDGLPGSRKANETNVTSIYDEHYSR